ncbi:hypothetical protein EIP91_006546 [Steccherinum ochraceum]|uniref:Pyruvate carboxylase n=1 Tax=Steccherinum ochraceum TaxID=92696 RepID=A0A4V2MVI6_9APHY|nr:hypothetical protein EIP91_006546 [Steccherinum ochraceum]
MPPYKVLVANRGEIAIRVLRAASEVGWSTVAIYAGNDVSHASYADQAIELDKVSRYMDAPYLVDLAKRSQCTHMHPAYGFLSENSTFAELLADASVTFIGPPHETLRIAADKMLARNLATSLEVPVAPGVLVKDVSDVLSFVKTQSQKSRTGTGFPAIIKALDGGGGRGIRIVRQESEIEDAFKRCMGESPSRQLFVEAAKIGPGWKHVEVQIIGDGSGEVTHLWERECSVQRRFQKIVEMAPSSLPRSRVQPLLDASMKMARDLQYRGLGTFEYLVDMESEAWVFLEVNPRLQVEHTVTEEITGIDVVRASLLLSLPGASLKSVVPSAYPSPPPPTSHAIQLRLTAEDPRKTFQLSTGTIKGSEVSWPGGHGVRVDTWLSSAFADEDSWEIGTEFDSLLAKVIVSGETLQEATQRASRALREVRLGQSVKTNRKLLAGIVEHPDWLNGRIDTLWLERNLEEVLTLGAKASRPKSGSVTQLRRGGNGGFPSSISGGSVLIQPGTTFNLALSSSDSQDVALTEKHAITISSIAHNAFPDELSGTLQSSFSSTPMSFHLARSTSVVASASGMFESPNTRLPGHVPCPLTGKIVELHPALLGQGDGLVRQGETLAVISVMKMETVVNAPVSGKVERLGRGVEEGVIMTEGMLLCVLDVEATERARSHL